ncbi:MAG: type II toxin-antitoxin system HicB family antitoxin [Negativicutes bacterium]|nr:type II toxin-antitoxin system HicB family antitoxin [Negativicutes bacterium]
MKKELEYYLSLPYRFEIIPAEEGGFVGVVPELPGCITQGETLEDTVRMINDAMRAWIECALEEGITIPEPVNSEEDYSGKFVVRVPKSLHRDLVRKAKEENVSLNQLTAYLLSSGIGRPLKK